MELILAYLFPPPNRKNLTAVLVFQLGGIHDPWLTSHCSAEHRITMLFENE